MVVGRGGHLCVHIGRVVVVEVGRVLMSTRRKKRAPTIQPGGSD